ncbi:MAG: hypothetical protein ABSA83_14180 [Verrucomicrobiota bacterium]|jgi:hypothetical protein
MKNPIISELRRIRDAHAKQCRYDFDTLALDWMKLDRREKGKAVKLQRGRIVPAFLSRKAAPARAGRKNNAAHK